MKVILLISIALPLVCRGALVGAPVDITINPSDPNVAFALGAINDYYAKQGDNAVRHLTRIVKVQSQVVAGTLYHFVLQVESGDQSELCEVKVWSKPWLPADQATTLSEDPACKPAESDHTDPIRPLAGGETPIDINNDEVQKAMSFAVTSLNAQENYFFYRKPVKVEQVTSQIVSGISYHFRGVHMAATGCTKNSNVELKDCSVVDGANTRVCDFDVWSQAWMTPQYKLINVSCQ